MAILERNTEEGFRRARKNLLYLCVIIWIAMIFVDDIDTFLKSPFGIGLELNPDRKKFAQYIFVPIFLYYFYKFYNYRDNYKLEKQIIYNEAASISWGKFWLKRVNAISEPTSEDSYLIAIPLENSKDKLFDFDELSGAARNRSFKKSIEYASNRCHTLQFPNLVSIGTHFGVPKYNDLFVPNNIALTNKIRSNSTIDYWVILKLGTDKNIVNSYKRKYRNDINREIAKIGVSVTDVDIPYFFAVFTGLGGIVYILYSLIKWYCER